MVSFDFLSKPICLSNGKINVLCIENHQLFRKTVNELYNGCDDESAIVFSENYNPVKFKNNVCFISDFFNFDFSSQLMKKIYEELSLYANTYLQEETATVKADILNLLEKLSQSYCYDFDFKDEADIVDLLKLQNFKPVLSNCNLTEKLLDFIIMMKKYSSVKCFVLLNLHSFFGLKELDLIYKELNYQNAEILVIENVKHFNLLPNESVCVIDEDMCEIVDLH